MRGAAGAAFSGGAGRGGAGRGSGAAAVHTRAMEAEPQPAEGVTYARKLAKDEARVDWSASAATIARRVRAFNPVPGAWTGHDGERLRVLRARPAEPVVTAAAGTVLGVDHAGVRVATGEGALLLETLQWPGARALPAFEAAGRRLVEGAQLT